MPAESSNHPGPSPAALRVAVIEDDRTMRALLVKLIGKQADLEVCGAWGSGEEALAALAHQVRGD